MAVYPQKIFNLARSHLSRRIKVIINKNMKNSFSNLNKKNKNIWKAPKPKTVNRFWGNAARLEHKNVSGKKGK